MVLVEVWTQPNFDLIFPTDANHIILHQNKAIRFEQLLISSKGFINEVKGLLEGQIVKSGEAFFNSFDDNGKLSLGSTSKRVFNGFWIDG